MRVALGVPTLRRYDLLVQLICSAEQGTRPPDAYIVVDNGGKLDQSTIQVKSPLLVVSEGKNIGVAASWNRIQSLAFFAGHEAVLIVADDVVLAPDAFSTMAVTMLAKDADFVYPDPQRSTLHETFTCFMVRQRLFEKVGLFDEVFWPAYFEDNDFHRRMRFAGVREAVAPTGYEHFGSATIKTYSTMERARHDRQFDANKDRYVSKWGGLPGHERFDTPFGGVEL